ncbi:unnamed protein product [Cochlearia groenlandica]
MLHETWFRVLETALHCPDESRPSRQSRSQNSSSAKAKPKPSSAKAKSKPQDCRSHKCKRDQRIVRTSLVHQDDDLACDEGRSHKLPKSLSSLSYRCKGEQETKEKKTVAKRAIGQSHMCTLRARSNLALEPKSRFRYYSRRHSGILVARASSLLCVSFTGHPRCSVFRLPGILVARCFQHPVNNIIGLFRHPITKLSVLVYSRLLSVPTLPGARLASISVPLNT